MTHLLITAETGRGKSTLLHNLTNDDHRVLLDPQKNATSHTAWKASIDRGSPAVLEDLDDLQRGLPLNISFKTERDREEVIDSIMGRRNQQINEHPMLEIGMQMWMRLVPENWPIKRSLRVFRNLATQDEAMSLCRDAEAFEFWEQVPVHPSTRERIVGPAERALSILGRDHIAPRIQPENRLIELLERGVSIFVQGGERASDAEVSFVLRWISNKVLRWKTEVRSSLLKVIYEEAGMSRSIGPHERKFFMGQRKRETELIALAQNPWFEDKETTEAVMQNSAHFWGRCGSEGVAEIAAKDIAPLLFNPRAIKQTYQRLIQLGDQQFEETRHEFLSVQEQIELLKGIFMNMPLGWWVLKHGNDVSVLNVPRFETRVSDDDAEIQRRNQEWLVPLNTRESAINEFSTFSTQHPSRSSSSSDSESSPPTTSPLDALFD